MNYRHTSDTDCLANSSVENSRKGKHAKLSTKNIIRNIIAKTETKNKRQENCEA